MSAPCLNVECKKDACPHHPRKDADSPIKWVINANPLNVQSFRANYEQVFEERKEFFMDALFTGDEVRNTMEYAYWASTCARMEMILMYLQKKPKKEKIIPNIPEPVKCARKTMEWMDPGFVCRLTGLVEWRTTSEKSGTEFKCGLFTSKDCEIYYAKHEVNMLQAKGIDESFVVEYVTRWRRKALMNWESLCVSLPIVAQNGRERVINFWVRCKITWCVFRFLQIYYAQYKKIVVPVGDEDGWMDKLFFGCFHLKV